MKQFHLEIKLKSVIRTAIILITLGCITLSILSCTSSDRIEGYLYYRLSADPVALDPALITDVASADRKSTRLNSSHIPLSRMPSSA